MNNKISSQVIKAIAAGAILLLLMFVNSSIMLNDTYAAKRNTPVQNENESVLPKPFPEPIIPPGPSPIPPPGLLGTIKVLTKVSGGDSKPSDFTITVTGNNPNPASFSGSASGTTVTLKPGKYSVSSSSISGYSTSYSSGCSGSISGGKNIKFCTVTNKYTSPPGSKTFLSVITQVDNTGGGTKKPSDFTTSVSGNNPKPSTFSGSSAGTSVTMGSGSYSVSEDTMSGYSTSYSSGCSGTASGGVPIKCTITNKYNSPLGSKTFLSVITQVDNTGGGTNKPSDFTISVSGNNPKPTSFTGSSSGTSVTLLAGRYSVSSSTIVGYTTSYSSGCSGIANGGLVKCTITNKYVPTTGTLAVTTIIHNTDGGTKKPSDFTISVSGNSPNPASFSGSASGTTVTLKPGKYSVSSSSISGYSTSYSPGCSGIITGAKNINPCTVTNQYTLIGSLTFLNVITKVDNTDGGTKKPSDFTITVYGNNPSPKSFSGTSDAKYVTLSSGTYQVTQNNVPDYRTSYSSGCSGTANGGVPITCTIVNQYNGPPPAPPSPPINPSGIIITANSTSVYSIPSTFVKVDRFGTNYTVAGNMSFINSSRSLINSTIVNDFDKNPNIGYVVNNSSSLNISAQPGLPNPFVGMDAINQKIMNETQNAITAAFAVNPPGKNVEIKCTFGMVLADYRCS